MIMVPGENHSRLVQRVAHPYAMFRFAVSLTPAAAGALSAAQVQAQAHAEALPGGKRG